MRNTLKIVMVIIGTLIGAGFASGREIYLFFLQYGVRGFLGIVLTSTITSIIIYQVLNKIKKGKITNYKVLLQTINPKYKKIRKCMIGIVDLFLLISFYIMVAGFSAYLKQSYEIPVMLSSTLFVLVCFIVFIHSIEGVMKVNELLVPILIFFILYLGIKNVPYLYQTRGEIFIQTQENGWLIKSILYASYNSILLIPVLTTIESYLKDKKQILTISVVSGLIIFLLAIAIFGLLIKGQFYISQLELPMVQISLEFGKIFQLFYGVVIIASIFTSAVSTGYSLLQNVGKNKRYNFFLLILLCTSAIFVSKIGFSNLVERLYPLFGILGLIQIIFFTNTSKLLEKNKKN